MDRFFDDLNVERYRKLASPSTSKAERKVLLILLAAERSEFKRRASSQDWQVTLVDEMINAVEPHHADRNEVDGDDVTQQPRHDQDQNTGYQGDDGSDMTGSNNHFKPPGTRKNDQPCSRRYTAFGHGL